MTLPGSAAPSPASARVPRSRTAGDVVSYTDRAAAVAVRLRLIPPPTVCRLRVPQAGGPGAAATVPGRGPAAGVHGGRTRTTSGPPGGRANSHHDVWRTPMTLGPLGFASVGSPGCQAVSQARPTQLRLRLASGPGEPDSLTRRRADSEPGVQVTVASAGIVQLER
jgi:hypothetical protein